MHSKPPPDISETYGIQNLLVHVYQTSGCQQRGDAPPAPHAGQADAFGVMQATAGLNSEAMHALMDQMHRETEASQDAASTGLLVSLSSASPADNGAQTFNLTHGHRGDSHFSIVRVDAAGDVHIEDVLQSLPNEGFSVSEFGFLGDVGQNNVHEKTLSVAKGEQVYLLLATDGYTDAYLGKPGLREAELKAWIKAHPDGGDLAGFLTARALAHGAEDNTTVMAARVTHDTDLKGQALIAGVFDGTGHDDDRVSSCLSRLLKTDTPHAVEPLPLRHERPDHLATRPDDIKRTGQVTASAVSQAKTVKPQASKM